MKTLVLVALLAIAGVSFAGTLTIVPDSTSSMGREQTRRELAAKAQAERQARIAAGLEQPAPKIIIIKQAAPPPQPRHLDCYAYGYERSRIACD